MTSPFPINTTVPATNNDPADDQPIMLQNTQNTVGFLKVDHIAPGTAQIAGYHNLIHMVAPNDSPGFVPSVNSLAGQLYTANTALFTNDPQLFYLPPSGGGTNQLTGSLPIQNGYGYMAGLLVQWGFQPLSPVIPPSASQTGVTDFNTPYPTACFVVIGVGTYTTTPNTAPMDLSINTAGFETPGVDSFGYTMNSGSQQLTGFFWVAIGK